MGASHLVTNNCQGTITLPVDQGPGLVLKEAYYCKEAKGTLISVAGLIEAGATLSFKGDDLLIRLGESVRG
ncbi:hypothetical protein CROQUDRAFT_88276 [Cronartium quercuum f. sp. fusiforme G11]|uniref:Uncharacterized protein n=1 Tax=Cronartium quercuum f. sp. fusiforme G11 TaxID=708437 RepID=A0A9P6NTY2_9BASI|nr:hypothetical protein CROQUDRAFT_88276 [Cronartium quercuum f. sp. fusiforme G11]